MSQDDSGIIISTILNPVPTSIPLVPPVKRPGGGAGTPFNVAFPQSSARGSVEDRGSYNAILITNAASAGACLCVIVAFYLLRRKHARLMKRTTLMLSLAMAATDLVFHVTNLAGYGDLPPGIGCALVGGWLFAAPTILSLFYACAIALNTQLVFVHHRTPSDDKQKWFLSVPPITTLLITIPTLAAGVYGFDPLLGYCWYAAEGVSRSRLLMRMILTFDLWCFLSLTYLLIAAVLILRAVFSSKSRMAQVGIPSEAAGPRDLEYPFEAANPNASLQDTLDRRDAARRGLTLRLFGYILVPVICVLPGVILDFVAKTGKEKDTDIDDTLEKLGDVMAGLMGSLNAILFGVDPSVLAVLYAVRVDKEEERRHAAEESKEWDSEKGRSVDVDSLYQELEGVNVSVEVVADQYHGL